MNGFAQLHPVLRLALPLLFTVALLRPAYAAESITMIWINAATAEAYEVTSPDDKPLLEVKQQVMSDIGLSPLQSPLYVVEKVVVTRTPVRGQYDPITGLPLVITTEEYVLLNETTALIDLEIVAGDTLRLRQIAVASEDDTAGDTTQDTTADPADDSAGDTTDGDVEPVKSRHNHDYNKRHHRHHGWEHNKKHSGKRRFG